MDDRSLEEKFALYKEEEQRAEEEKEDATKAVMPPADIVAFTEQRSCADLLRMYQKGQLDINPDFQRGEVWTNRAQTLFIDSLKKQFPIPSMCISLDIGTTKRLMIDGLQRITSIIKFLDDTKSWTLAKVDDVDPRLYGKKTSDIRRDDKALIDIIENVTIPITVLRCDYSKSEHMQYLFQIFNRLNTGGNRLYNQEIRNCIFQGSFNNLLKELARIKLWLDFAHTTETRVDRARFSNEERILRFFAFNESYQSYEGKLAEFLNSYMEEKKNSDEITIDHFRKLFQETLDIAEKIGEKIDSKNVADAVLVGIAKNIYHLKTLSQENLKPLYNTLLCEPEFSQEEIREGVGTKEKVRSRICKSIDVFSRG